MDLEDDLLCTIILFRCHIFMHQLQIFSKQFFIILRRFTPNLLSNCCKGSKSEFWSLCNSETLKGMFIYESCLSSYLMIRPIFFPDQ
ncbi:hypothetical protein L6452_06124 [Arctium lappa]|uniref:Uncharacterized protein n=1 Tax=Arctium lappa TaxID=4217 RepID=A0ACB9EI80_ARCLA|nr:hypothetical protein L6452_06124 [Arctium lappa]